MSSSSNNNNNNNNNHNPADDNMGDIFTARRAAAAARQRKLDTTPTKQQQQQQQDPLPSLSDTKKRPSLLDIQKEQEAEERTAAAPSAMLSRNSNRGGMMSGGGNGGGGNGGIMDRRDRDDNNSSSSNRRSGGYNQQRGGGGDHQQQHRGGGGYNNNNNNHNSSPRKSAPPARREEGAIASLLESFGFIRCAERNEEIFFHYSELPRGEALDIGQEVEFDVGASSKSHGKSAAYKLHTLPQGTVQWEVPEYGGKKQRGRVDTMAVRSSTGHNDRRDTMSSSSSPEGIIRIDIDVATKEEEDEGDNHRNKEEDTATSNNSHKTACRYTLHDYKPTKGKSSRLVKGDVVEFVAVTERRTGKTWAREIVLIRSERERVQELREKKMLAEATPDRGVVVSLQDGGGTLRATAHRDPVFFRYAHVEIPDQEEGGGAHEYTLAEGQEMEFLVCKEEISTGGGRNNNNSTKNISLTARKITFLRKGSVQFHVKIATGVAGVIVSNPTPSLHRKGPSFPNNNSVPMPGGRAGKVRLEVPLPTTGATEDSNTLVTEVLLHAEDAPGGIYAANRDGSQMGLWVHAGDTILFDVVREVLDGSYRAVGTTCLVPSKAEDDELSGTDDGAAEKATVRLIRTSLAGRSQGFVSAVKEGFGFITCAERNVDLYFRLYELFPKRIQTDLLRNMPDKVDPDSMYLEKLVVGTPVIFDLSVAPPSGGGGRRNDKENLKGQRIAILPKGSFTIENIVGENMVGVISQEHNDGSGFVELETPIMGMLQDVRHPIISQLLNNVLASGHSVMFPNVQSTDEARVVIAMAESKGLEVSFVGGSTDVASPDPAVNGYAKLKISMASLSKDPAPQSPAPVNKNTQVTVGIASVETPTKNDGVDDTVALRKSARKRHPKKPKPVKQVRFERGSISRHNQGGPPGLNDVVVFCIVQSRRTGQCRAINVKVTERKMVERGEAGSSTGTGLVTEVVPARHFGFISLLDESATKRELLFFHTSSVVSSEGELASPKKEETPGRSGWRSKGRQSDNVGVKKGDEVKFDIGKHDKNGKRIALNVVVLPYGTLLIPSKPEKNACEGIILMKPSHTILSNTPAHATSIGAASGKNGGGRWNVSEDVRGNKQHLGSGSNMKEEGLILLISDPSSQFSNRQGTEKGSDHTLENEKNTVTTAEDKESSKVLQNVSTPAEKLTVVHLRYRSGSVALRGAGSSSSADASGAPRRGDLVSFVKGKGSSMAKDVRIVKRSVAITKRGRLTNISSETGTASFVVDEGKRENFVLDLNEIVSCGIKSLVEGTVVEGILHDGSIYGVCRVTDLYLDSKVGTGKKERPRLNLTVKKELQGMGGKIVAQSGLAKGPDGSIGFAKGWTSRISLFAQSCDETEEKVRSGEDTN